MGDTILCIGVTDHGIFCQSDDELHAGEAIVPDAYQQSAACTRRKTPGLLYLG